MNNRKKPILAFLFISIIFASLLTTSFLIQDSIYNSNGVGEGEKDKENEVRGNQSINPVFIDDLDPNKNWSKTSNDNSWCSGSGSWEDPYLIANISINGNMLTSGITIMNSNKSYFLLKNVTIFNCGGGFDDEAGVKLINTNNGTIMNSNCSFTRRNGILLINSHNNTIFNNTLRNNVNNQNDGIQLEYSNNNTISNNLIKSNGFNTITKDSGIKLLSSNNTKIIYNEVRENLIYSGIYLENSINNTISYNNLTDNNADGLTLVDSHNNTVEGNKINENDINGIQLTGSFSNRLIKNIVEENEGLTNENGGIKLISNSDNNWIESNNFTNNKKCGVIISSGKSNSIVYNRFVSNDFKNAVDEDINNIWDNGSIGNYWSDYPYVDGDDDGIGDRPYYIEGVGNAQDNFPEWEDGEDMPKPFILTTNAFNPDNDGIFNLTWTQSINAVNYSVYSYHSEILEINNSVDLLFDGIMDLYQQIDDYNDGKNYFIIRAFNQYNFSILSNCININITKYPRDFILSTNANQPDFDGNFNLTWTESLFANNYSVYQYHEFITEINGSLIILETEITELSLEILHIENGTYFFIIVGFNDYANLSSNCIQINVNRSLKPFTLSSDADYPDNDGDFKLSWTESLNADNYSIYEYDSYITEINGSLTEIEKQIDELTYGLNKDDGVYYYIIVAFNVLDNLSSNCIEIIIDKYPHSFILSSDADYPDNDGDFELSWTESLNADNYSIYEYDSYITEVNESLTLINEGIEVLSLELLDMIDGVFFYIIVSFNIFGNISSNCIEIIIDKFPQAFIVQSDALEPDNDGIFYISWTNSLNANNYCLYQYNSYISEINDSLILVKEDIINRLVRMELTDGIYYFIVIAFNNYGNITSNVIKIRVERYIFNGDDDNDDNGKGGDEIPTFDFGMAIFWIATAIMVAVALLVCFNKRRNYWDIKWKRKRRNNINI